MYNQPALSDDITKMKTVTALVRVERPPSSALSESIMLHGVGRLTMGFDQSKYEWGLIDPIGERYRSLGIQVGSKQAEPLARVFPRLKEASLKALGQNGVSRFESFRLNQAGWYFGFGEPLNYESVQQVNNFFALIPMPPSIHPSIFLSEHGFLALGWENKVAGSIELEFGPSYLRYSFEKLGEEGELEFGELLRRYGNVLKSA
jgi:hypothetical protein